MRRLVVTTAAVMFLLATVAGIEPASAATLGNPVCTVSNSVAGASGVTYRWLFTTATSANLTSVTMTVPAGTGGSPSLGVVAGIPGSGTISLASNTLTYAFPSTLIGSGTTVTLTVNGLTNAASGTYTSTITTYNAAVAQDSGSGAPLTLSPYALTGVAWSPSTTITGAAASYQYGFTTDATGGTVSSVTMTVPPGTGGTPAVGAVSGVPSGGTVALASNTLTYSFTATALPANTAASIQITGLTNPTVTSTYPSEIATKNAGTPVDSGWAAPVAISGHVLASPVWTTSSTVAGAAGASYTYGFVTATSAKLTSVTMTVPPGTAGTAAVGAVSGVPSGGSLALGANTLTYSFTPTTVAAGVVASIQVTGLTNTATAGTYPSVIATSTLSAPIDTGLSAAVTLAAGSLTALSWSASSTATGGTAASYTFGFTTASSATLTSVTMTVPPGTAGTPAIGTVTPGAPPGGTIALVGNRLVYSFTGSAVSGATPVTIQVTGLTNTTSVGTYPSEIATGSAGGPVDAGTAAGLTFPGGTLAGPTWSTSATTTGATGVSYTFAFTTASTSSLSSVTLTVPTGTSGASLSVTTSSGLPTGSATLAGTTVTDTFTSTRISAGSVVSLTVGGFTNTSTAGAYASTVTTRNATTAVDTGTTTNVIITAVGLTTPAWATTSTVAGAGASYTFTFKPGTTSTLSSVTMTVPPGTAGTPTKGTVTPTAMSVGGAVSLTATTLTYTFTSTSVTSGTAVSIQITGLTNTATTGSYTSTIDTFNGAAAVNSGVTAAVGLGTGVLGSPRWTASATGAGATGVTYTYSFTTATAAALSSVTMTLPTSTVKTLTVGAVSGIPTGTASMTTTLVTYTFASTQVAAGTAVSIAISGFTNTATAGSYTSTVTTLNGATGVDAGTSAPALVFTTGTLTAPTWKTSSPVGGATATAYTYAFTNPTSQTLNQVTMTVPAGTTGTPAVGTVTPTSVATGGTVSLTGTTLTYGFTSGTVAAVAISIQITGLTNTSTPGTYTSLIYELNAGAAKASAVTPGVGIAPVPPSLTVTDSCGSTLTCTTSASQNRLTLIAIPGAPTITTGAVVLAVQTDAGGGYDIEAEASPLTTSGGSTLPEASTSGLAAAPVNQFFMTAALAGSGASGAALCNPFGSSLPFVGYSTSSPQSLWSAPASTGTGTDTVTLANGIQVSALQPAGVYAGYVNYTVLPSYTGTAGC